MRTLLLSSFVIFASLAGAQETQSVSGQWQVHMSVSGTENDMTCTFTQRDDILSGNCASDKGKFDITGKVTGKKVAWSYKSEYDGTPLTVKFDGSLDSATKMTGSVNVPEFSADGDFTAKSIQVATSSYFEVAAHTFGLRSNQIYQIAER